jgi:hypothetical protein
MLILQTPQLHAFKALQYDGSSRTYHTGKGLYCQTGAHHNQQICFCQVSQPPPMKSRLKRLPKEHNVCHEQQQQQQ